MRITKYEHATLTLEKGGDRLVIDPGSFLASLTDFASITAVVLTHEHPDHWTERALEQIREANPDVPIFGPEGVANAVSGVDITVVSPGDTVEADGFTLQFFGGEHAVIHSSIPVIDNVGVLVDGEFYYPGDSYSVPEGVAVDTLAAPAGGPWLKIGEAMDFVLAVAPRRAFGTHDMTLSAAGRAMHRDRLAWATEQGGGTFHVLEPGESLDI